MKNRFFLILILLISSNLLIGQSLKNVSKFGRNPGMLKMYLHVPKNLDKTKGPPLVLVLHGCTQTAKSIGAATGWNKLADSLGFIVLYPEQRMLNNVSKCFNFFIGMKAKKDKGETASIRNMIDYMYNKYKIDSSMVFITGMSAGAGMSNVLLNAYPEVFNAGALLAAPPTLLDGLNETSTIIPRIVIIQGDEDNVTNPKMGEKVLTQWITKNKMDSTNLKVEENFMGNNLLSTRSYYNSEKELKIVMLNIKNTGHKILIDPGESLEQGGRSGIHTKDIDFHSTYWLAKFFGLVQ
ncbi:MAG: PHB depolymerase family esterase [Flavobacteriales bacterium]|nr:PHB depolymerase family esterase [Flavobacteriales bacterium]